MDHTTKRVTTDLLDHRMHMIRHDDPREQQISFTVKVSECIADDHRVLWLGEDTVTKTAINCLFQCEKSILAVRRDSRGLLKEFAREAVRKPERNCLNDRARIKMRDISPTVPTPMRAGSPRSDMIAHASRLVPVSLANFAAWRANVSTS